MLPIEQLQNLIKGKKVAFIGAGVSHKRCIEQFVELGAQVTLCDQKSPLRILARMRTRCAACMSA